MSIPPVATFASGRGRSLLKGRPDWLLESPAADSRKRGCFSEAFRPNKGPEQVNDQKRRDRADNHVFHGLKPPADEGKKDAGAKEGACRYDIDQVQHGFILLFSIGVPPPGRVTTKDPQALFRTVSILVPSFPITIKGASIPPDAGSKEYHFDIKVLWQSTSRPGGKKSTGPQGGRPAGNLRSSR